MSIARANDFYGIPDRQFVSNTSKATAVKETQLEEIKDDYVRMSLELQRVFGLRREEAIKFIPRFADQGDHIVLKASWTKGGKERVIPLLTTTQRDVLDRAHRLAGAGALIPSDKQYIQQLRVYERHTTQAGLSRLHGLRHAYAQQRYLDLTGWLSPAAGGPSCRPVESPAKTAGPRARLTISQELGHVARANLSRLFTSAVKRITETDREWICVQGAPGPGP